MPRISGIVALATAISDQIRAKDYVTAAHLEYVIRTLLPNVRILSNNAKLEMA